MDYLGRTAVEEGREVLEDKTLADEAIEYGVPLVEKGGEVLADTGRGFVDSLESFGSAWR